MPKSPILGGFSTARSPNAADNAIINLAVEITETKDGKVPGFLFNTAGLDLVATIGSGPIRGVHNLQDVLYVTSGPEVWSLTANGVATLCGSIGNQSSPVCMFDNGKQLLVLDGVGGWLVPGGYPLTGGVIAPSTATSDAAGGLYAVNDTITLLASSGSQSSFPILTVTGVTDNPVTAFTLPNAGTTYNTATSVVTTGIGPQPGIGSGLTMNIVGSSGPISSASVNNGGAKYTVNDTGNITVGTQDAVYRVTSVSSGAVTGFILLNPGTSYGTATGVTTAAGIGGVPAAGGSGLTINITASAGPITASSVAFGGRGYAVGNAGFVSGGTGDATYLVTTIGPVGNVVSFKITQAGSINSPATSFSQKSTSGSGSGLVLTSPTFGTFVGLVPVTLPFNNPLVGGITDGFGVMIFQSSQDIAESDELDLSTWQPLNFGVADQSPDNCISLAVIHDEVYILKEKNTEVWVDQGTANFSLAPLTGVHMESGCMAPYSPAIADEELFWLSRNQQGQGIVVKAAAYNIQPISTQALTAEFDKYPNLGDAIGYARQQGGHVFYVLTFPEANKTWVYDKTASAMAGYPLWHQIAAFENGRFNRHWGNCYWPWRGSSTLISETTSYQANSVTLNGATLDTDGALVGIPPSFFAAVFSAWLDIPDSTPSGPIIFEADSGATPALIIQIQNDATGTPQIIVTAWDLAGNTIVSATYDFTDWAVWVNVMVSIDTATHQLQVFANTIVASVLVETLLTPTSITWMSSNPIAGVTVAGTLFGDDGGVLVLPFNRAGFSVSQTRLLSGGDSGYPVSPISLPDGAVWDNGLTVGIIPGITPDPLAPPLFFGIVTPAQLLALGGGNLPLTNPGIGTLQLWNDGGLVAIA